MNASTALELGKAGYSPIPILPASKNPGFEGWQTESWAALIVAGWPSEKHGIGLRTGEKGLVALDIDIYDAPMVDRMKQLLRTCIGQFCCRVGQAPKTLVPVLCPEITSRMVSKRFIDPTNGTTNAIEILSTGQQFIHTGIHPDTQLPYQWYGELPPLIELPTITFDLVQEVFEHFYALAAEAGWQLIVPSERKKAAENRTLVPEEYEYNSAISITDLLIHYGWKPGKKDRWTRPGKNSGVSGTVMENTFYPFTSSTVLEPDMTHRPYDIVLAYDFNGDTEAMEAHIKEFNADRIAKVFSAAHGTLPPGASVTPITTAVAETTTSLNSILEKYEVRTKYVDGLGKEKFYYDNLIIKNHILTIIAESGGGKTTFLYFCVSSELARQGLTVWYIDADSPPSDHKKMKQFADEHGIKFLIPDVNEGTSTMSLLNDITVLADSQTDLNNYVFVFDTLKKFIDLMSKQSAKEFFVLMRRLTKLGGTVVLPGHANKHRDTDGNLIFEGVGDVKSDSDDMIFFEKDKKQDGTIDVTTVVDADKGAKVRGIFKPFSFNIDEDRQITFYDRALNLSDMSNTGVPKATSEDILVVAEAYLKSRGEPVGQAKLAEYTRDKVEGQAGKQRVRETIVKRAVKKGDEIPVGTRFVYTIGQRNSHCYELPEAISRYTPPPQLPV